jgi:hypothetical protein
MYQSRQARAEEPDGESGLYGRTAAYLTPPFIFHEPRKAFEAHVVF